MKQLRLLLAVVGLIITYSLEAYNIGLLVMATGKYTQFVGPLIASARKHFCTQHKVTYFVFTDGDVGVADDVIVIHQKRLGWPYDTMMRFAVYAHAAEYFEKMDYVFSCDADMLFVGEVGDEILGDRVATQHPGFVGRRGTYETNPASRACVHATEGEYYFAGGFYGGSQQEFLRLITTNVRRIEQDLVHKFIAVWHDESHLNRYFIDNKPTVILSALYCCAGNRPLPQNAKLVALVKNHELVRE